MRPKSKITLIVPLAPKAEAEILRSVDNDIKVILERGTNTSANRNRGISKAKTPLIAFANGHTLLFSDWKHKVYAFFEDHPEIDIVGGPELNSENDNFFGRVSGYALSSPFGSGGIWKRYGGTKLNLNASEMDVTSANLICRRRVFDKVNFHEGLYPGEDPRFISDAKAAGFKVAYSPDIRVSNKRRPTLTALIKQIFRYGLTRPKKETITETIRKPFFFIPSVFVIYLLSLFLVNYIWYLIPLYLYIVLLVTFTIHLSLKNKDPIALLLLPIIFPAIHISYGLGMLKGIFSRKNSK